MGTGDGAGELVALLTLNAGVAARLTTPRASAASLERLGAHQVTALEHRVEDDPLS
jgi:hypothetical protein